MIQQKQEAEKDWASFSHCHPSTPAWFWFPFWFDLRKRSWKEWIVDPICDSDSFPRFPNHLPFPISQSVHLTFQFTSISNPISDSSNLQPSQVKPNQAKHIILCRRVWRGVEGEYESGEMNMDFPLHIIFLYEASDKVVSIIIIMILIWF